MAEAVRVFVWGTGGDPLSLIASWSFHELTPVLPVVGERFYLVLPSPIDDQASEIHWYRVVGRDIGLLKGRALGLGRAYASDVNLIVEPVEDANLPTIEAPDES